MNDRIDESFSALLDGEASEVDVQRLLKAVERDPGLLERWHRLSRAQGALQGDRLVDLGRAPALLSEHEPEQPAGQRRRSPRWLGQAGLAATLAVVMLVTVQWSPPPAESPASVRGTAPVIAQTSFEARQRLLSYLRQHAEAASYSSGHVVAPYQPHWESGE